MRVLHPQCPKCDKALPDVPGPCKARRVVSRHLRFKHRVAERFADQVAEAMYPKGDQ